MTEIMVREEDIPQNLRRWASHLRDEFFSLPAKLVREQAPQLLSDFEILTSEQAKDPQQYRAAVSRVGIDKVLVVD